MTFSNGSFNPNPLANPFNTRLGPANYSLNKNSSSAGRFKINTSSTDLPEPTLFDGNNNIIDHDQLTVPNQDIPPGDQLKGNGFLNGSDSVFRLQDGTIIDFKSRKVLHDPNDPNSQYWGDPTRKISFENPIGDHPSNNQFDKLVQDVFDGNTDEIESDLFGTKYQLDQKSLQYWIQAEKEADQLMKDMTPEQIQMIKDFEDHFPMSKLIEESKKMKGKTV